jgi:hypothetical protein
MINKIKENQFIITVVMFLVTMLKTCSISSDVNKLQKDVKIINDSTFKKSELKKLIILEGLKSEKRMIQSTDRKMLDVNRQTQIDLEIEKLEKK